MLTSRSGDSEALLQQVCPPFHQQPLPLPTSTLPQKTLQNRDSSRAQRSQPSLGVKKSVSRITVLISTTLVQTDIIRTLPADRIATRRSTIGQTAAAAVAAARWK
ncbi:hypothetical protein AMS68_003136 [Peltaster fructicola]|uniref:Uncharacterized protein n=1 Tax=Peltaster fructicola TaxID=286661 RepID=A0A6H0XSM1_9PEZI|nr:hypothetical protein AMS68_003136 [Peltaster fructicola]